MDRRTLRHLRHLRFQEGCSAGCSACSAVNGCLSCRAPYFLSLRREGARQLASCHKSCPAGFYKTRLDNYRVCARCFMPGCRVCRRADRCSVCEESFRKDLKSGLCVQPSDETSVSASSMPSTDLRMHQSSGFSLNSSSFRKLRLRRRKKGRKNSNARRRRLRGRGNRRLNNRRRKQMKLRKLRKLDPAENEVLVDTNLNLPLSLKGSTSLNHEKVTLSKRKNVYRGVNTAKWKRLERIRSRNELDYYGNGLDDPLSISPLQDSRRKILKWSKNPPQVSLARPSRHIKVGFRNAINLPKDGRHVIDNSNQTIHEKEVSLDSRQLGNPIRLDIEGTSKTNQVVLKSRKRATGFNSRSHRRNQFQSFQNFSMNNSTQNEGGVRVNRTKCRASGRNCELQSSSSARIGRRRMKARRRARRKIRAQGEILELSN
ncbi:uncharacterized protein LOC108671284 isoform X2 [Hyalella azteca]|uniref:Uncharacterized protein LOC108671284 isoform X2 n=1 Tax=Hyalella azteca TaxID=294128 RepID=A0A979FWB4_HYAAZ|nr:uncharacterized protein LOC108671284 isoform X2 [Hyalella azteca]